MTILNCLTYFNSFVVICILSLNTNDLHHVLKSKLNVCPLQIINIGQ